MTDRQQHLPCSAYRCERKRKPGTKHCRRHGGNARKTRLQERLSDRGDWIVGPFLVGARPYRLWRVWWSRKGGAFGINAGWLTASVQYRGGDDA